jgi:hypothetical protein
MKLRFRSSASATPSRNTRNETDLAAALWISIVLRNSYGLSETSLSKTLAATECREAYAEFKDAVIAHRRALKGATK